MKNLVVTGVVLLVVLVSGAARAEEKKPARPVVCALENFSEGKTAKGQRVGFCAAPGKRPVLLSAWSAPVKVGEASFVVGTR